MKSDIQAVDQKVWNDVESNMKVMSDDEALLVSTGKVGELKRYGSIPGWWKIR
jgi:hypothetical protein